MAGYGDEWSARRRARRAFDRLEARGEMVLDAEAVGVTYADERWRVDLLGDAWDWGGLRIDFDRLVFVGEHSRFELRSSDVLETEIRRYEPGIGGTQPRLYLRYLREGKIESIGLDLPSVRGVRRRVERIEALQERIERWREERSFSSLALPSLLPELSGAGTPKVSRYQKIGRPAKALAAFATLVIAIAVQILVVVVLTLLGFKGFGAFMGGFYIFWMWVWIVVAEKIERRVPAKWRFQEPTQTVESIDLIALNEMVEEEIQARA